MGKKLDPKEAEAVMLRAGLKPLEPYKKSDQKWKCLHIACGQIVAPTFASVNRGQGGCYECGRRQSEAKRRMPEEEAVAIMLKAGMKPLEPYKNAISRWKCECLTCGHIGFPQLTSVNSGQGGCRPCSFVKTGMASRLSEKEARSRLKKQKLEYFGVYEWHGKLELFKVKCLICRKNSLTSWSALDKKGRQLGCRTCSRKSASSLQVTEEKHIKLLIEHNLEALGKYTGNNDLVSVNCLICGNKSKIRRSFLQQRKNKMQGCITCSGARIADPKKIARVMKKAKLQPLVPYSGGHKRWKCKCLKCENIVYPEFNSVLRGQGGCVYCAEIGFNYKKPAYVYLIFHDLMGSIKVGVTNIDSKPDRIKEFQKYGWSVFKLYRFDKGIQAFKVEQEILNWLRKDLNFPQHLTVDQMPKTGGQSETVSSEHITILQIQKKIDVVIKGHRKNP